MQGFGMLRTYLPVDAEPRLQVWDQRLAQDGNSTVHDHPWDFTSIIYAGVLFNQRYVRNAIEGQIWQERMITPGSGGGIKSEAFDTRLGAKSPEVYGASEEYSQTWDELHLTRYLPGTVTFIQRDRVRGSDTASSFSRGRIPWTFFHPRPATKSEIKTVIGDCLKAWWL